MSLEFNPSVSIVTNSDQPPQVQLSTSKSQEGPKSESDSPKSESDTKTTSIFGRLFCCGSSIPTTRKCSQISASSSFTTRPRACAVSFVPASPTILSTSVGDPFSIDTTRSQSPEAIPESLPTHSKEVTPATLIKGGAAGLHQLAKEQVDTVTKMGLMQLSSENAQFVIEYAKGTTWIEDATWITPDNATLPATITTAQELNAFLEKYFNPRKDGNVETNRNVLNLSGQTRGEALKLKLPEGEEISPEHRYKVAKLLYQAFKEVSSLLLNPGSTHTFKGITKWKPKEGNIEHFNYQGFVGH